MEAETEKPRYRVQAGSERYEAAAYGAPAAIGSGDGFLRHIVPTKTNAGVHVSEHTARNYPIVYACVNRIANPLATFPLQIMRPAREGGHEEAEDHPLAARIKLRPNDYMSSRTLRKTVQGHALLWGNGYIEIERNRRGQAVGLWPLLPDRTRPRKVGDDLVFDTNISGTAHTIDHMNVIHIMDQSQDGYVGLSQVAMARQAIGLGFATEEFGAKFFANDAKSGGFLMHPGKLGPQAQENLRGKDGTRSAGPASPAASLERQGGLDNAHRVKVLEEGMKFIQTTIPPEDAQFLGTREMQIAEIARIYDVPLILVQTLEGTTGWGTAIEQLMIGFVIQTIHPWVQAWEQELNWKLFTEKERRSGYFVKFNMNALLRGDMTARAAFYKAMFELGMTMNQILALEDMNGIGPTGDVNFVSNNVQTVERAINPPEPAPIGSNGGPAPQEENAQ